MVLSFKSFVGDKFVVMFFGISKRVNDLFMFVKNAIEPKS
jgi:hypothetical protein